MVTAAPKMFFDNVYFITGTAYAGKSTAVAGLAERHGGIACGENYHEPLMQELDREEFPCLCYTRDMQDWRNFIRRTPEEYKAWVDGVSKECEILELRILSELVKAEAKPVFVDTNICLDTLREIAPANHVLIMLAEPGISVSRFFDRPDPEKQFLYRLLMEEPDPAAAVENFRRCLELINSQENYDALLNSGFNVLRRDPNRTPRQTLDLIDRLFELHQAT